MKRPRKRQRRRYRGRNWERHLDGTYRPRENILVLVARHEDGRYWFVWTERPRKQGALFSSAVQEAVAEGFAKEDLHDPETPIPDRQEEP